MDKIAPEERKYVWMERPDLLGLASPKVPAGYEIRTYRSGDAAGWTELQREVRDDMQVDAPTFDNEFGAPEETRSHRILFAIAPGGKVVGSVAAWYGDEGPSGKHGSIHWMAVLKAHRERGLGTALLLQALQTMSAMHSAAYLSTATFLLPAVRMYLKAGFRPGIASDDDRSAWEYIGRHIPHPAIHEALTRT